MKKTFYVSVQGRSVLEDPKAASYEWVIEAEPEEAEELRRRLSSVQEAEEDSFMSYVYPWPDSPEGRVNAAYSDSLNRVYREIYRLGSPATRNQMEQGRLVHGEL
ncbi:hypothetical protein [Paenibacillus sp. J22TS3]|uniref:hypothetical protein n=1 Tax=Paenibacillus sp. J22TS3 TaxID=2807192 RepID=UPI001B261403|nr:hypothetical protein [Paenibacillus sp. J22TS3]GIP22461.1 hypothetical protein J22TS3_27360 [Paenibacillus sp. J22TS3]